MDYQELFGILLGFHILTFLPGSFALMQFKLTPQNKAVMVSDDVTLSCQIEQDDILTAYIHWEECITNGDGTCMRISNDLNVVYTQLGGDATRGARYNVINPGGVKGRYDLTISGVMAADAGVYRCLSRNAASLFTDAQLITLASNPECSSNITQYTGVTMMSPPPVEMQCSVTFNGPLRPVTTFQISNDDGRSVIHELRSVHNESVPGEAWCGTIYQPRPRDHGKHLASRTFFKKPASDADSSMAQNAPTYMSAHTFGRITASATTASQTGTAMITRINTAAAISTVILCILNNT